MAGTGRTSWRMSRRSAPLVSQQAEGPTQWPHISCDNLLSYMRRALACRSICCRNWLDEERHSLDQPSVAHSGQSHLDLSLSTRDNPRRRLQTRALFSAPSNRRFSLQYARVVYFLPQLVSPIWPQEEKRLGRRPASPCGW